MLIAFDPASQITWPSSLQGATGLDGLSLCVGDCPTIADADRSPSQRLYSVVWGVLGTASMAISAYHGYRRHGRVGPALGWALLGGLFPVITPTIAFAQGFAQPKRP